jgi:hypothetical protein
MSHDEITPAAVDSETGVAFYRTLGDARSRIDNRTVLTDLVEPELLIVAAIELIADRWKAVAR